MAATVTRLNDYRQSRALPDYTMTPDQMLMAWAIYGEACESVEMLLRELVLKLMSVCRKRLREF